MSVAWTEDQKKVIGIRNKNLLVSAAAGSGKTAVLVERILELITDPEHPIDVDRLLITTFTKAAAGEMRDRIGRALSERLKREPGNEWLKRQEALLSRAQITTIHGFCLYVIRNYFHTIDLNPNFRIADEGEIRLLRQDTADEILEEAFRERRPELLRFAESYGSGNRGSGLKDMILQLYEYAVASPQPERWLAECACMYELPEGASWSDFAGADLVLLELRSTAADCLRQIEKAREISALPGGPAAYDSALQSDEEMLQGLLVCKTVDEFAESLAGISYQRLPSRRAKAMAGADEEMCLRVSGLRDAVKKALQSLQNQYFRLPGEVLMEQMRKTAENVNTYIELTLRFMERLTEKKRKKNILDFSDQEHLALKILTREEDGKLVPSQAADVFADYFAEIMVDEYQDSNLVQEAILESISGGRRGHDNRFMVGDVKQSIYRFRQAEPGLFLDKYRHYQDGTDGVRVDLHRNFRSREQVLNPVNEIFYKIMRRELGGVEYDDSAALRAGASYPEQEGTEAELLLLSEEEWDGLRAESGWSKQEVEAYLAAERIKRLLADGRVAERGSMRPVKPGDIVILLRTMSGWSETFVRVLQEQGIPARAQSREGYFQTMEVETLLSYLRVLDNPTQEIPLAAAMHGLLGGFSSQDLARIKAAFSEEGFAAACRIYRERGDDEDLRKKLDDFYKQADEYRRMSAYTAVHELLWQIVTKSGYLDEVSALPGGEQRLANVEMLLTKAQDYEKISYHGLFHFIRYIEKLQRYEMDFGEAVLPGESGEAVQIMSIHHSKGLEFPVVFVAGLGKHFNRQESRDRAVMHNRWGIGLDYVDLKQRRKRPVILKQLIRRQNRLESLGEELRVLYVAMTRAKEKLILTGMAKEKLLQEPGTAVDERLLFLQLSGADSFLDWIVPAANADGSGLTKQRVSVEGLLKYAVRARMKTALSREELEKKILFGAREERLYGQIDRLLSWNYPWDLTRRTKQKYSVTELKKLRMREESDSGEELYPESDVIPLIPQFIEKTEKKTGAALGTLYHTVMEWLDLAAEASLPAVEAELLRLTEAGKLTGEEQAAVRAGDFLAFLKSDLAARMRQAAERGELFREQPFVIGLPGDEADGSDAEETVLIQGIIDAFFYEEDWIVVVDYKTDHVRRAQELAEKYHAQLEYYGRALQMMTGREVKERLIYSFALGEVTEV